jgi:hypothetical protein
VLPGEIAGSEFEVRVVEHEDPRDLCSIDAVILIRPDVSPEALCLLFVGSFSKDRALLG